jgi:hypothetical protein
MRQREKLCRDAGTERGARPKAEENKRRLGENQNVSPEGLNRQTKLQPSSLENDGQMNQRKP